MHDAVTVGTLTAATAAAGMVRAMYQQLTTMGMELQDSTHQQVTLHLHFYMLDSIKSIDYIFRLLLVMKTGGFRECREVYLGLSGVSQKGQAHIPCSV